MLDTRDLFGEECFEVGPFIAFCFSLGDTRCDSGMLCIRGINRLEWTEKGEQKYT